MRWLLLVPVAIAAYFAYLLLADRYNWPGGLYR